MMAIIANLDAKVIRHGGVVLFETGKLAAKILDSVHGYRVYAGCR
jgi:hypothetical protein